MTMRKAVTAAIALCLGLMLALGTAGSLITGFGLSLDHTAGVVLCWFLAALLGAAAYSWKRGGLVLLLLGAVIGGYLWRQGNFQKELAQLVYRISYIYDQAYGWGYLPLTEGPWDAGTADLPLAVLGCLMALLGTWTVCRGETAVFAIGFSLTCLIPCLIVTDTVPDSPCLYVLLLALALLLFGNRVRQEDGYQGDRLTLIAALPLALSLGILFLAMPRDSYVNHSAALREEILSWFQSLAAPEDPIALPGPLAVSAPREPATLNLSSLGPRRESGDPVFTVTAQTGGPLYLRGRDYDIYDGGGWAASDLRVERLEYAGADLGPVTVEARGPLDQTYLPYYPRGGVSLIGGRQENTRLAQSYTMGRMGLPENWQSLSAPPEDFPGAPGRYLDLPSDTLAGAAELLPPILALGTTGERARAIGELVRGSARYDLAPGTMPQDRRDFALWFLRESDRGYCVHFATASAVLLRAAGIPARYVSGYMLEARAGEPVTVTGENAHAWAEYYDPGLKAWLVLESTPGEGLPAATEAPTEPAPPETEAETRETTLPTEAPAPETLPETPTETAAERAPVPESQIPDVLWQVLWVLGGMAALVALLEGQYRLRRQLTAWRKSRGTPNVQALARWREAEKLAKLLKQEPPQALTALAEKAKYSQHTLTPEELDSFGHWTAGAEEALRGGSWFRRLWQRYVFAVRSF